MLNLCDLFAKLDISHECDQTAAWDSVGNEVGYKMSNPSFTLFVPNPGNGNALSCFLVSSRSEIDEVDIGRVTDKDGYNTKPPPSPSPISHNAHKKETAKVIH